MLHSHARVLELRACTHHEALLTEMDFATARSNFGFFFDQNVNLLISSTYLSIRGESYVFQRYVRNVLELLPFL